MKARPAFTIEINKEGKSLSFGCSFLPPEEGAKDSSKENRYNRFYFVQINLSNLSFFNKKNKYSTAEDFQIDEFAIHEHGEEWSDKVYTVDCTVLDGVKFNFHTFPFF